MKKMWYKKMLRIAATMTGLFIFAYLLNFFWESLHAVFLYEGHDFSASLYVSMISYVSMIDGFLVLAMYGIISLLWRDIFWIKRFKNHQKITFLATGLIMAAFIEYRAVFLQHRWSYDVLMPTIFGLGLSPSLQLSITGFISLWLIRRFFYEKGVYYGR